MTHLVEVLPPEQKEEFRRIMGNSEITADSLARTRPDESLMLVDGAGARVARCSLWWRQTPLYGTHRIGLIGHYADSGIAGAAELLGHACARLLDHGCTLAVGPMDGSTWNRYRFITERGSEPQFLLELDNADDWPDNFVRAGFSPLAEYFSSLNPELNKGGEILKFSGMTRQMKERGIHIRELRLDQFEAELRRIYQLSIRSFPENFLYTPICEADFIAQYCDARPFVRPEFVLLVEREERLVGYVFGIPDLLQARRGAPVDTVIIKTLAVDPDFGGVGIGGWLVASCEEAARRLGFRRSIHALMHESNRSGRIGHENMTPMRRYTLYSKQLSQAPTEARVLGPPS